MMRVVIDTNVVLSGLIKPDSVPGQVLRAWRDGSFRLVLSEFLIEEIAETLARPKIQALVPWSKAKIDRFVIEWRAFCEVVELANPTMKYPRAPDDVPVLATLIASGADLLVTGDRDLLALREQYSIEAPAQFIRRL
jgi:putative PIN family toxin of toxin-antitoxin system